MTPKEIEQNLSNLVQDVKPEDFIFDFLLAFGFPKASVSRLRKGDFNMSKVAGEILYKGKLFFKESQSGQMLFEIENLAKDGRILKQNPRFLMLTDFENIVAKDLKTNASKDFPIGELPNFKSFFIPLTGAEIYKSTNDNKADREASYSLAKFYDIIIEDNPGLYENDSHSLNILLSRLLFCFFAEDTGIFEEEGMFTDAIGNNTSENGKDLDVFFKDLFAKLNSRKSDFPSSVKAFPYVNGGLFKDEIKLPKFSKESRKILIESGNLNWGEINPDIFGSMIQAVADPEERSDLGMHYTSVPNILKLIKPLFLDELYEEFENNRDNAKNLEKLLNQLSKIKFFDPACGSGNFLIITYKELRLLEIKIIQQLIDLENEELEKKKKSGGKQTKMYYPQILLSQFYGIEIKDFAHEMAILSLWLAEHQMNKVFVEQLEGFGQTDPILPLKESGKITQGNAATYDWEIACPNIENDEIYIIGNPPYLGFKGWDIEQKKDMSVVFNGFQTVNRLDYISCWFKKGTDYIKDKNAKLAFVSTNSICQGEQVSLIWPYILSKVEINFAYTSFSWSNNAKGNAGVSVVIISLANKSTNEKNIFSDNIKLSVKSINPYLAGGSTFFIQKRNSPISELPQMMLGSSGIDGGHLILSKEEKQLFIKENQNAQKFIKKFMGGDDFLNGMERYCLWIDDDKIEEAFKIKPIRDRIDKCKLYRISAGRDARKAADVPHRFFYRKYQDGESIVIPFTSSSNRDYIPVGIESEGIIISNGMLVIYNFHPFHFGILSSKLHMLWTKAVGGKMRDDIRYSVSLIYNTFPFPKISLKQRELLNEYVFAILDERSKFPQKTMAWLYNPETMPSGLKKAHQELDEAIERVYRLTPFTSDAERLEYLFKMYDDMTKKDTLFAKEKKVTKKKAVK